MKLARAVWRSPERADQRKSWKAVSGKLSRAEHRLPAWTHDLTLSWFVLPLSNTPSLRTTLQDRLVLGTMGGFWALKYLFLESRQNSISSDLQNQDASMAPGAIFL